jgi:hypothetical protein
MLRLMEGDVGVDMGRRNREVAAGRFGLDVQAATFRRMYQDVAAERPRYGRNRGGNGA